MVVVGAIKICQVIRRQRDSHPLLSKHHSHSTSSLNGILEEKKKGLQLLQTPSNELKFIPSYYLVR